MNSSNLNVSYADYLFNQGRIASFEGIETNPYQPNTQEQYHWLAGWCYQETENMTAEENRKRIAVHLEVHGPTSAADLEKALTLTKGKVWHALKDRRFKQGHAALWMMSDAEEIKPVNVIQHLCVIEQIDNQIQECQKNIRSFEEQIEACKQLKAQQDQQIETLRIVKHYHEGQLNEHAQTTPEESTETPRR